MKKILLLSFVMVAALSTSYSQNPVPNPGFENWSGGNPDNWSSTNITGFIGVTQSSDAHTGTSSARGDVISAFGFPVPPLLFSLTNDTGKGFSVSQNFTTLEFWYKLSSDSGDVLDALVGMFDDAGNAIASGGQEFPVQSTWTHVALPIFYTPGKSAASCEISFAIVNDTIHLGSFMEIDDVSLTNNPTGITQHNPAGIQSFSVFPNPAKGEATVRYFTVNASPLEISLYDMTGKKVFATSHPTTPGMHQEQLDVSKLNSGAYLCMLKTGNDVVKKVVSVMK